MQINHINIYTCVGIAIQASNKHNGLDIQLKECKKLQEKNKSKYITIHLKFI